MRHSCHVSELKLDLGTMHGTLTPHCMSPQSCNEEFFTHERVRERERERERVYFSI